MESSEPSTSAKDNISSNPSNDSNQSTTEDNPIDSTTGQSVDEFLSTGRTGRRNALPDILEQKSSRVNTSDLPNELQKLNFEDSTQPNGSSGDSSATASCSNQNK